MKTMKIALSIVAIAAIAAIYSTGAFVPQTHGIENTFEGFLVISDAEMAQHVGGPDEGIQRVNHSGPDQDVASCGSSNPDCNIDRQVRDATLYACDNCPASVFDNYDNTWHHADKYSYYYYVNGNRKTSYQGLRILFLL